MTGLRHCSERRSTHRSLGQDATFPVISTVQPSTVPRGDATVKIAGTVPQRICFSAIRRLQLIELRFSLRVPVGAFAIPIWCLMRQGWTTRRANCSFMASMYTRSDGAMRRRSIPRANTTTQAPPNTVTRAPKDLISAICRIYTSRPAAPSRSKRFCRRCHSPAESTTC
jgi:hypothetical protein